MDYQSLERIPFSKVAELDRLDESEMVEGYWDGYRNDRRGDNRRAQGARRRGALSLKRSV